MRALALLLLFACYDEPSYENLRCSPALPCPAGLSCVDERCTRPEKDAGMLEESDCAPCDLPLAVCAENDSVYRSYVNLGACSDDPAQCIFVAFDMPCDDLQGGCRTAGYCVPAWMRW